MGVVRLVRPHVLIRITSTVLLSWSFGVLTAAAPLSSFSAASPADVRCVTGVAGKKAYLPAGRCALLLVDVGGVRTDPTHPQKPRTLLQGLLEEPRFHVLFYARYQSSVAELSAAQTNAASWAKRIGVAPERVLIECLQGATQRLAGGGADRRELFPGLYLMDGEEAAYRYIFFNGTESEDDAVTAGVLEALRDFLSGREPRVYPLPLLSPGARVEARGLPEYGAYLLYPFTGREAGTFPKPQTTVGEYGRYTRLPKGLVNKLVAELLSPIVADSRLRGLGVVADTRHMDRLNTAFPEWEWVLASGPDERIRYKELLFLWVVYVRDGHVHKVVIFDPRTLRDLRLRAKDERFLDELRRTIRDVLVP